VAAGRESTWFGEHWRGQHGEHGEHPRDTEWTDEGLGRKINFIKPKCGAPAMEVLCVRTIESAILDPKVVVGAFKCSILPGSNKKSVIKTSPLSQ
jgi:hypothetical protein